MVVYEVENAKEAAEFELENGYIRNIISIWKLKIVADG